MIVIGAVRDVDSRKLCYRLLALIPQAHHVGSAITAGGYSGFSAQDELLRRSRQTSVYRAYSDRCQRPSSGQEVAINKASCWTKKFVGEDKDAPARRPPVDSTPPATGHGLRIGARLAGRPHGATLCSPEGQDLGSLAQFIQMVGPQLHHLAALDHELCARRQRRAAISSRVRAATRCRFWLQVCAAHDSAKPADNNDPCCLLVRSRNRPAKLVWGHRRGHRC